MTRKKRIIPSLYDPVSYQAIIEQPLLDAFPLVWDGAYYFDPLRGTAAATEANNVLRLIRESHDDLNPRTVQYFNDDVFRAVQSGSGRVIPLSAFNRNIACYVMTEHETGYDRLSSWFGSEALTGQDLGLTTRLFQDFVARHETFHSVEMLQEDFVDQGTSKGASESGSDSYAILSMARDYGAGIAHHFGQLAIAGRTHQGADKKHRLARYATQDTIRRTLDLISEQGDAGLALLSPRDLFIRARDLSKPAPQPQLTA